MTVRFHSHSNNAFYIYTHTQHTRTHINIYTHPHLRGRVNTIHMFVLTETADQLHFILEHLSLQPIRLQTIYMCVYAASQLCIVYTLYVMYVQTIC